MVAEMLFAADTDSQICESFSICCRSLARTTPSPVSTSFCCCESDHTADAM